MPYVGKKPADIIATAVDTTTGKFSGVVDADAGITVDNITIDGTEIDLSSGDLTLDVAGNIILDADGGNWKLMDAGTEIGRFYNDAGLNIWSVANDTDIKFLGTDGGSAITALTLDMSEAGNATFNGTVLASNGTNSLPSLSFSGDSNTGIYRPSADNLGFAVGGVARAFMSGTQFNMTGNGVFSGTLTASSGNVTISDGNLVVASGHGIDFGATGGPTSGSGSSELLDDYEEGTWTPSLSGATSGTRPADSGHKSTYTKVGNIVHVTTSFGVGGLSGTASGKCRIEGLPFNYNGSNSAAVSSFFCSEVNLSSSFLSVHIGNASSGTSNQFFPFAMRDDTSSSEIDFSSFDGDSAISFSISYQVA